MEERRHQAAFNGQIQDWISEDLRTKLEDYFEGRIPTSLESTIKAGEQQLSERKHLLKIADSYGWQSAREFMSEELARNEKEEVTKDKERVERKARAE